MVDPDARTLNCRSIQSWRPGAAAARTAMKIPLPLSAESRAYWATHLQSAFAHTGACHVAAIGRKRAAVCTAADSTERVLVRPRRDVTLASGRSRRRGEARDRSTKTGQLPACILLAMCST